MSSRSYGQNKISLPMLTYFLLYPSTTRALHTETAVLGLSVSVVEAAIDDVFGTNSDIATSQNLVHDMAVNCFKCPFTHPIHTTAPSYCPLHGRGYSPRSSSSTRTLRARPDFAPVGVGYAAVAVRVTNLQFLASHMEIDFFPLLFSVFFM
jgi:hypothetical protein